MLNVRKILIVLIGFFLITPDILAQDDGGASIVDGIKNAGAIGAFIIMMSVVAMALVIEHFMTIKREKLAPPEVIDEIEELFNEKDYQAALEACEEMPCYFTNVT